MDYQGRPLVLEFSSLADQANASVIGKYGDTEVLVTAVMGKKDENVDFFPLVVDYEERFYAVGKILGSRFMRREGRASDEAVLSGRLIDRTIRPLFDHRMRRKVQVVVTILQLDPEDDPDFITLLSASTALAVSDVPWNGPVAGVKMLRKNGELTVNPANSQIGDDFEFVSFVAGTQDRINMIELEGVDSDEKNVVQGFAAAQKEIAELIKFQEKIIKEMGKPKTKVGLAETDEELKSQIRGFLKDKLESAVYEKDKQKQYNKIGVLKEDLKKYLSESGAGEKELAGADHLFEEEINDLVHKKIIEKGERPDGRKLDEVRSLYAQTGVLKRAHGSSLFIRGNTQALAVVTLAAPEAEKLIETIEFSGKKRFLLHYNFPPYSVGEVGNFRGPGRREIGHGALAEKAVKNLVPIKDAFPYTIRVVSEILASNGSSSMATVCASSMALMDAGVPMKKPVAGIAMGLMLNEKKYKILTDIQGPEDHHGDMDFKVAGTKDGVAAVQMDVKIDGLTNEILAEVLEQGKKARLEILETMQKAIAEPRKELSPYAPVILSLDIHPSKIGEVIGPGGKIINGIIEKTGAASIDIEQTGKVFITAASKEAAEAAYNEVAAIVKEYELGEVIHGKIVKILEFGAIVEFGGRDGMIHVSELRDGYVKKVEDVVKIGDEVWAKIIRAENGKIGLSLKGVPQKQ